MWERDDVGHCPERVENIGWGNLMKCEQQPECIFLEEEAQDHEASYWANGIGKGRRKQGSFKGMGKRV